VISLGTIIEALHDSEINGAVSWIYDGVWTVQLGVRRQWDRRRSSCRQRAGSGRMATRERGPPVSPQRVRATLSALGKRSVTPYNGPPRTLGIAAAAEPLPPPRPGLGPTHGARSSGDAAGDAEGKRGEIRL
jgi:hypothetical protein